MRVFFTGAKIKTKSFKFICENKTTIINTAALIFGVCAGSAVLRLGSTQNLSISSIVDTYTSSLEDKNFFRVLLDFLFSILPYLAVIYASSFTAFGFFAVPLLLLFRGMGLGITLGCLCVNNSFKGIAFGSLVLVPPAVISCVVLILACNCCMTLSIKIAKMFRQGARCLSMRHEIVDLNISFLKFLTAGLGAAVLDATLSSFFKDFFIF